MNSSITIFILHIHLQTFHNAFILFTLATRNTLLKVASIEFEFKTTIIPSTTTHSHVTWCETIYEGCYNGPRTSRTATIILKAEERIIGRQQISELRRGVLNESGSEQYITVPVSSLSYNLQTYMLPLPYGNDVWNLGVQFLIMCL